MAPRVISLIPVMLDKPRQLRFDFAAIKVIEDQLAVAQGREYTFFEAMQRLLDFLRTGALARLSMTNLSILLWGACCHEDSSLTLEHIENVMPHVGNYSEIFLLAGKLLEAWNAGAPPLPPEREVETERSPLDGSTGLPTGPLRGSTSDSAILRSGA